MAVKISRRKIAQYVTSQLIAGRPKQVVMNEVAAYLIESRRLAELDLVIRDIHYYLAEAGYIAAELTSAYDLSDESLRAVKQYIKDQTKAKQVSLRATINASVIGGIKVDIPGRESNQTIAHQLTVLKTRFKKV